MRNGSTFKISDTVLDRLYSFILKLVPCIVLTVITGFLIHALYKAEERSARLKNGNMYRRPSEPPQPRHKDDQVI